MVQGPRFQITNWHIIFLEFNQFVSSRASVSNFSQKKWSHFVLCTFLILHNDPNKLTSKVFDYFDISCLLIMVPSKAADIIYLHQCYLYIINLYLYRESETEREKQTQRQRHREKHRERKICKIQSWKYP